MAAKDFSCFPIWNALLWSNLQVNQCWCRQPIHLPGVICGNKNLHAYHPSKTRIANPWCKYMDFLTHNLLAIVAVVLALGRGEEEALLALSLSNSSIWATRRSSSIRFIFPTWVLHSSIIWGGWYGSHWKPWIFTSHLSLECRKMGTKLAHSYYP